MNKTILLIRLLIRLTKFEYEKKASNLQQATYVSWSNAMI